MGLRNAAVMDQQELPMSSVVNTATIEQEKQTVSVDEDLIKERVTVRHTTFDVEDCSYMLRVLGGF